MKRKTEDQLQAEQIRQVNAKIGYYPKNVLRLTYLELEMWAQAVAWARRELSSPTGRPCPPLPTAKLVRCRADGTRPTGKQVKR